MLAARGMTSAIEVRQIPARLALIVHERCPTSAVPETLGKVFGGVHSWAAAHAVPLGGPAVARYDSMSGGTCELDAGFLVDSAPKATDSGISALDLGGCTAACATHMGSYDSLAETYGAVERWIGEHSYVSAGPMWEEYFSPPATPPAQTRTDVYWPVRKG